KKEDKRVIFYISIFLMGLPNLFNYILGQVNLYVTFLILLSLFLFIKYEENKWNLLASFILGLSIIIKPIAFLLIPFLIIINVDLKNKKIKFDSIKSLLRLIGVLTPILFNLILFFLHPTLWEGFLEANFIGNNPIAQSFSFSISQLITNFYYFYNIPFNQIIILIVAIGIIGGIGYIIFIFGKYENDSIIYGFVIGTLITLLGYFDSWDHHLLNLIPLLIITIFSLSQYSKHITIIKASLIFLSFFSLIFTGIWFQIYSIFPYNFESTIFLILTFYAICNYYLYRKLKENKEVFNIET
ncbi:MAG: glycosyltransferase 87 family protein, partial [Promethearchaeota archaeon]